MAERGGRGDRRGGGGRDKRGRGPRVERRDFPQRPGGWATITEWDADKKLGKLKAEKGDEALYVNRGSFGKFFKGEPALNQRVYVGLIEDGGGSLPRATFISTDERPMRPREAAPADAARPPRDASAPRDPEAARKVAAAETAAKMEAADKAWAALGAEIGGMPIAQVRDIFGFHDFEKAMARGEDAKAANSELQGLITHTAGENMAITEVLLADGAKFIRSIKDASPLLQKMQVAPIVERLSKLLKQLKAEDKKKKDSEADNAEEAEASPEEKLHILNLEKDTLKKDYSEREEQIFTAFEHVLIERAIEDKLPEEKIDAIRKNVAALRAVAAAYAAHDTEHHKQSHQPVKTMRGFFETVGSLDETARIDESFLKTYSTEIVSLLIPVLGLKDFSYGMLLMAKRADEKPDETVLPDTAANSAQPAEAPTIDVQVLEKILDPKKRAALERIAAAYAAAPGDIDAVHLAFLQLRFEKEDYPLKSEIETADEYAELRVAFGKLKNQSRWGALIDALPQSKNMSPVREGVLRRLDTFATTAADREFVSTSVLPFLVSNKEAQKISLASALEQHKADLSPQLTTLVQLLTTKIELDKDFEAAPRASTPDTGSTGAAGGSPTDKPDDDFARGKTAEMPAPGSTAGSEPVVVSGTVEATSQAPKPDVIIDSTATEKPDSPDDAATELDDDEIVEIVDTASTKKDKPRARQEVKPPSIPNAPEKEITPEKKPDQETREPEPPSRPYRTLDKRELTTIARAYLSRPESTNGQTDEAVYMHVLKHERFRDYAEALNYLLEEHPIELGASLYGITNDNREMATRLGIPAAVIGNDEAWAFWDIAKQRYFFDNRSEADTHYTVGDPLQNIDTVTDISNRHLGWLMRHAWGAQENESGETKTVDAAALRDRLKTTDETTLQAIIELLQAKPNSSKNKKELSSTDLAKLGALARRALGKPASIADFHFGKQIEGDKNPYSIEKLDISVDAPLRPDQLANAPTTDDKAPEPTPPSPETQNPKTDSLLWFSLAASIFGPYRKSIYAGNKSGKAMEAVKKHVAQLVADGRGGILPKADTVRANKTAIEQYIKNNGGMLDNLTVEFIANVIEDSERKMGPDADKARRDFELTFKSLTELEEHLKDTGQLEKDPTLFHRLSRGTGVAMYRTLHMHHYPVEQCLEEVGEMVERMSTEARAPMVDVVRNRDLLKHLLASDPHLNGLTYEHIVRWLKQAPMQHAAPEIEMRREIKESPAPSNAESPGETIDIDVNDLAPQLPTTNELTVTEEQIIPEVTARFIRDREFSRFTASAGVAMAPQTGKGEKENSNDAVADPAVGVYVVVDGFGETEPAHRAMQFVRDRITEALGALRIQPGTSTSEREDLLQKTLQSVNVEFRSKMKDDPELAKTRVSASVAMPAEDDEGNVVYVLANVGSNQTYFQYDADQEIAPLFPTYDPIIEEKLGALDSVTRSTLRKAIREAEDETNFETLPPELRRLAIWIFTDPLLHNASVNSIRDERPISGQEQPKENFVFGEDDTLGVMIDSIKNPSRVVLTTEGVNRQMSLHQLSDLSVHAPESPVKAAEKILNGAVDAAYGKQTVRSHPADMAALVIDLAEKI